MLLRITSILILLVLLSGCVKKISNICINGSDLPLMPIASDKVLDELETVCNDETCYHLNNWLNDLNLFEEKYLIYKTYMDN